MPSSLNQELTNLSSFYYLKNDSREAARIEYSVNYMIDKIKKHFGSKIHKVYTFGSWERDTILPRRFDKQSDVDIMVVFNHSDYDRTPETYRSWLLEFAKTYYPTSDIYKSSPTIVIELGNIKIDLVPAKEELILGGIWSLTQIPISTNQWGGTDPKDVKESLTRVNQEYNGIVRPVIRLLKAWNSKNDYPFNSYLLEKQIISMNFSGDNIETGFYYVFNRLTSDNNLQVKKVLSAQAAIEAIKNYLYHGDKATAYAILCRILPT